MAANLTLDSFRSMIGENSYGEVRLRAGGGLEKINSHFLQRIGLFKTTTNSEENLFIRHAFLTALRASAVPKETLDTIRERLGLPTEDSQGNAEIAGKPLSRRDIRDLIEMADKAKVDEVKTKTGENGEREGHMVLALSRLQQGGADDLEQRIAAYNKDRDQSQKINLSSTEIKILFRRHLADLSERLVQAKGVESAFMEKVRTFVSDKNLKAGTCKFTESVAENRDFGDGGNPWNAKFGKMGILMDKFHVRNDHPFLLKGETDAIATFKTLELGEDDLTVFSRKEEVDALLKKTVALKNLDPFVRKYGLNGLSNEEKLVFYCACQRASNFSRNYPIFKFIINGVKWTLDFKTAVEDQSTELATQIMVGALLKARAHKGNMTGEQFACLALAFDAAHMLPGVAGLSGYTDRNTTVTITYGGDKLSVKCEARGKILTKDQTQDSLQGVEENEPRRDFASLYSVDGGGIAKYDYVRVTEASQQAN